MSEYLKLCKPQNPLSRLSSHAALRTALAPVVEARCQLPLLAFGPCLLGCLVPRTGTLLKRPYKVNSEYI